MFGNVWSPFPNVIYELVIVLADPLSPTPIFELFTYKFNKLEESLVNTASNTLSE